MKKLTLPIVALVLLMLTGSFAYADTPSAGNTETFGSVSNVTITIAPITQTINDAVLTVHIKAPVGLSTVTSASLFEKYIFAGCVLDCPRDHTIDALWLNATSRSPYSEEVGDHTYSIPLIYTGEYYSGTITIPRLRYGSHSLVIYALGETNMMSFNELNWGCFLGYNHF